MSAGQQLPNAATKQHIDHVTINTHYFLTHWRFYTTHFANDRTPTFTAQSAAEYHLDRLPDHIRQRYLDLPDAATTSQMRPPPIPRLKNWRSCFRPCQGHCCTRLAQEFPTLYEPVLPITDSDLLVRLGRLVDTGNGVKAMCTCNDCDDIYDIRLALDPAAVNSFRSVYDFRNHLKKFHPTQFQALDREEYAWAVKHGRLRLLLARYLAVDTKIPDDPFQRFGPVCPVGNCSQSFREALIDLDGSWKQHLLDVHAINSNLADQQWVNLQEGEMWAQLARQKQTDDELDEAEEAKRARKEAEAPVVDPAFKKAQIKARTRFEAFRMALASKKGLGEAVAETLDSDSNSTADSWNSDSYDIHLPYTEASTLLPAAPLDDDLFYKAVELRDLRKKFSLQEGAKPLSTAPKVVLGNERDPNMFITDEEKGEDGLQDLWGPGPVGQKLLWRKVRSLGRGGFGTADLWILYDTHVGNVIKRVVVKEGFDPISDPRTDIFIDPPGSGKWVAGEGVLHKRMTAARQKYSAVLYHHTTLAYRRVMRLYLEYAPFGDLDKYGSHFRNGLMDEGFLWNVLHSLVSNLKTMHEGTGTEPFVHRDIKGANLLVVNARDKRSKKMNVPTPVLNDFGLARRLPKQWPPDFLDHTQWLAWTRAGTPGYTAPETLYPRHGVNIGEVIIPAVPSSAIDIYSVGATIHSLMQPASDERMLWESEFFNEKRELPAHLVDNLEMHDEYSEELKSLVRRCLKYRPDNRIALRELCALTKQGRDEYFATTSRPWPHLPDQLYTHPRKDGKMAPDITAVGEKVGALNLDREVDHAHIVREPFFDEYQRELAEQQQEEEDEQVEEEEEDEEEGEEEEEDDDEPDESEDDEDDEDEDNDDDGNDAGGGGRDGNNNENGGDEYDDDDDDEEGRARRARRRAALRLRARRADQVRQAPRNDIPDAADDDLYGLTTSPRSGRGALLARVDQPNPPQSGLLLGEVGQPNPPPRAMLLGPVGQRGPPLRRMPGGGRILAGAPNAAGLGRGYPRPLPGSPKDGASASGSGVQQTGGAIVTSPPAYAPASPRRPLERQEQSPPAYQPQSPRRPSPMCDAPPPQITNAPSSPLYDPNSPIYAPPPAYLDFADLPDAPGASPVNRPISTFAPRSPNPFSEDLPDVPGLSSAAATAASSRRRSLSRQLSSHLPSGGGSAGTQKSVSRSKSQSQGLQDKHPSKTRTPTPAPADIDDPQAAEPEELSAAPPAPAAAQQQHPAPRRRQRAAAPATAATGRPRRERSVPVRYGEWVSGMVTRKRKNGDGEDKSTGGKRKK